MRRFLRNLTLIFLVFMLVSCSSEKNTKLVEGNSDDNQSAANVLREYFTALHTGDYETAVDLYGGTYETMIANNPDIIADNHAGLLERACTMNGNMCLEPASIVQDSVSANGEYIFTVKFLNDDGTPFVLGPCCGANETDMPPVEEFQYTVQPDGNGVYRVLELPPYVP